MVPVVAFPPVFWALGLGQNSFLTAALFGAGTLWVDRRPILALTSSIVEYAQNGMAMREETETILVNSARIDVLEAASEEDLGMSREVELNAAIDPRAKDMTGGQATI